MLNPLLDMRPQLQPAPIPAGNPPAAPKRRKRKKRLPLTGWKFILVAAAFVAPFGVLISCFAEPFLPKHQAAWWEPIAFLAGGAALIAAIEILWKTDS